MEPVSHRKKQSAFGCLLPIPEVKFTFANGSSGKSRLLLGKLVTKGVVRQSCFLRNKTTKAVGATWQIKVLKAGGKRRKARDSGCLSELPCDEAENTGACKR